VKVLVTGHKGFIGSHAVERLQQLEIPYATYEWGDNTLPVDESITHVMHFGAISSTAERNVEKVMDQNYDFTLMLANLCQRVNPNIVFQFSSSASIYGLGDNFSETAPVDPKSPYAWSKYLAEHELLRRQFSLRSVQAFRYFNVYGDKGEDHKRGQASPQHTFRKQAEENGVIRLFEFSGIYKRDFIHVNQVLDYQFKFLNIHESGVWNIGSGDATSFRDIALGIAKKYGASISYIPMPNWLKANYQRYTCADLRRLKQTLLDYSAS